VKTYFAPLHPANNGLVCEGEEKIRGGGVGWLVDIQVGAVHPTLNNPL